MWIFSRLCGLSTVVDSFLENYCLLFLFFIISTIIFVANQIFLNNLIVEAILSKGEKMIKEAIDCIDAGTEYCPCITKLR